MRRQRLGAGLLLAMLVGVVIAPSAVAVGSVDRQAWAQTGPILTFSPADGEIYVAATAGDEEARSFVHVDVRGMDESTIRSSKVVFGEAESSFRTEGAGVAVCALASPIAGEGKLSGAPPKEDCTLRAAAQRADDGSWTVELNIFAGRWASGDNNGVALFPDPSVDAATFRVAFDAAATKVVVPASPPASPAVEPSPLITDDPDDPMVDAVAPPVTPAELPDAVPPQSGGAADSAQRVQEITARDEPVSGRSTSGSAVAWMALLVAAAVIAVAVTPLRRRVAWPTARERGPMIRPMASIAIVTLAVLPLVAREVIVYKAGVVLIFFVAAIGLHVLVNWAGELSLAHAGMVGLPAFSVLALSEVHGISPVYLLPVAVVIGSAVGAVVALPTLRSRGVQVALVTLIAGIAIDRFFFTKAWLVGSVSGRTASPPRLGPIEFTTNRSLYIVLVIAVAAAALAAWVLMHSKVARAWYWVRVNADAAAAFGVPVVTYRVLAYATGGAFAGLAGGLTVMWTQRLGPGAFAASSSFTYLLVAVLAGAGFLGGLVATTLMLPGGQQFAHNIFGVETGKVVDAILAYGGPLGLINVLVFHRSGLNGLGRNLMARFESSDTEQVTSTEDPPPERGDPVSLSLLGGGLSILAGFVAIALAWDHASRTDQLWVQNQEMLSGGIGGLALVLVGVGLLIRDRLGRNHLLLARQLESVLGARARGESQPEPDVVLNGSTASTPNDVKPATVPRRRPRSLSRTDG